MSATAMVQFPMDKNLKLQVEALLDDMGLNMSTAVNLFAKAIVNQRRIPFDIVASDNVEIDDEFYSESNIKYLKEAAARMDAGHFSVHELIEVKD